MHTQSLTELSSSLQSKQISSRELTQHFLQRIEQFDADLNSFITVTKELALEQAAKADERIAAGNAHPLTGIPMAHKDLFCTNGVKTSAGSKMLDGFTSPYDATVVENLNNKSGMVMLGKTNMDEFGMGSSNENSHYGAVKNPWDLNKVPGGSSGGSAAAVAARLAPIATGTDTGGSIRQPAAFCGISGIRPTYGRVSRFGMIAYASSLDQGGPFANSVEDLALVLEAMAGYDNKDSTCINKPVPEYSTQLNQDIKGLKVGLPKEYFSDDLDSGIASAIDAAIKELEKLGAQVQETSLPNTKDAIPAYYVIAPAECSSNLSRFDGVRYGHRSEQANDLESLYKNSRSEGFGDEVKRRIMIGTYALSAGYYDAYYLKAQKVRQLISRGFADAFKEVDVILTPTTPTTAFGIGEKVSDPVTMYLSDIYTISTNLAGIPGLVVPIGQVNGLPTGMQLMSNYFKEDLLLNVGHQYQKVTDWHTQMPAAYQ